MAVQCDSDLTIDGSFPTLAQAYSSLAAVVTAIGDKGVLVELDKPSSGTPWRFVFGLSADEDDNDVFDEACYRVVPNGDGQGGVELHKMYDASWTLDASSSALLTDHHYCDAVTLTDSGLAKALTGIALGSVNGPPALVCAADPGNALGFVRVFKQGSTGNATSCRPRGAIEA